MARISKIKVKELPERKFLSIRKTIDFFKEYSDFVGNSINQIERLLEVNEAFPCSGPIVCFHTIDLESLDVEIGFEVAKPFLSEGEIRFSILPTQVVVTAIDQGPYEQQDPTLEEIMNWISKHNFEAIGGIHYQYLNEEEVENNCLTEMSVPVKK